MAASESFQEVSGRLREGDQVAASQVFHRFAERLIGLARSRLGSRFQQKVDPEDVVQSVCKSFFLRHARGEFEMHSWDNAWTLLTVLTVRKCANQVKFFRTGRRGVQREETGPAAEEVDAGWQLVDREPTPVEAAMLAETVENLMTGLDPRDREILALHLQGQTEEDISAAVGYAQRTVRRVLGHIKEQLQSEAAREE